MTATRRLHPGLSGLVNLLQNHYLITAPELQRVEALEQEVLSAEQRDATALGDLDTVFRELRTLADRVIERELGAKSFDGIPISVFDRAIELATAASPEDDGARPYVGAVILKEGLVISEASRNQDGQGGHAEQLAVESLPDPSILSGSTVVTTLEPCTWRGSHGRRPCSEILLKYGVARVFIGLPDPNREIRGKGDLLLRMNDVSVGYFPSGLAKDIWMLNEVFIRHHTQDEFKKVFMYRC